MHEEAIFASYQEILLIGGIFWIVALIPVFFLTGRYRSTNKTSIAGGGQPARVVGPCCGRCDEGQHVRGAVKICTQCVASRG
jgi:hypothetical protein